MSIHGDVQFISQLKYKTHVAVIEKFTFMTSRFFFKENVRYPVWISLILGTRFSVTVGTR